MVTLVLTVFDIPYPEELVAFGFIAFGVSAAYVRVLGRPLATRA